MQLPEGLFRERVAVLLNAWQKEFEDWDPDLLECELVLGSCVFTLLGHLKCIVSVQAAVSQVWVAIASHGLAYHFFYDESSQQWREVRQPHLELQAVLRGFFKSILSGTTEQRPS